jgi:hypothetical protein
MLKRDWWLNSLLLVELRTKLPCDSHPGEFVYVHQSRTWPEGPANLHQRTFLELNSSESCFPINGYSRTFGFSCGHAACTCKRRDRQAANLC